MSPQEVADLLRGIVAAWPQTKFAQGTARIWHRYLEEHPAEVVRQVVHEYVHEGHQFGPSVSVILGKLRELSAGDDPELEAGEAWDQVLTFIRERSPLDDRKTDAEQPLLAQVVRQVGGWTAMRTSPSSSLHTATRSHFLRLYRLALEKERRRALFEGGQFPQVEAPQRQERLA